MDAQAVAAAAGVAVGTLNVWIQRGLIPGMTIGSRGRQRNFDLKTAVGIGIIGELVRFGFDAPLASMIVYRAHDPIPRRRRLLITRKRLPGAPVGVEQYRTAFFDTEGQLPALFQADGERPNAYAVIDLDNIRARMKQAEKEWQRSRNARDAKADD